jgi:hypothetical protein
MSVILITQEDHSSKLAQANSSQDPILKKPITKWDSEVAQGEGPEFKLQYRTHIHKKVVKAILSSWATQKQAAREQAFDRVC